MQLVARRDSADTGRGRIRCDIALAVVIADIHDQRIAFPMPARISIPEADGGGKMRHDNGRVAKPVTPHARGRSHSAGSWSALSVFHRRVWLFERHLIEVQPRPLEIRLAIRGPRKGPR